MAQHHHALELCFLPPYAPELNPDEYLNNDLKQQLLRRPKDKPALVKQMRATMHALQQQPERTRAYFHINAQALGQLIRLLKLIEPLQDADFSPQPTQAFALATKLALHVPPAGMDLLKGAAKMHFRPRKKLAAQL